jgi:chemotaxis family two-component system sensor kinase Cph1
LIVEIEPIATSDPNGSDVAYQSRAFIESIKIQTTLDGLLDNTVQCLRDLTDFDRVMIVRFDAQNHGEIIAESCGPTIESLRGLRFPEWDIPAQAREMMIRVPLRFVCDTRQEPIPIIPNSRDFDISISELRGVSPAHMAYLQNMDVQATMTLSIILNEALWGFISFHNHAPVIPTKECRDTCRICIEFFTQKLDILQHRVQLQTKKQFNNIAADLYKQLDENASITKANEANAPKLMEHFHAHGIGILVNGAWLPTGESLNKKACIALLDGSECADSKQIAAFSCLSEKTALEPSDLGVIAGVLIIRLLNDETIFLFRKAIRTQVKWAGAPKNKLSIRTALHGYIQGHPLQSM